jgi:hypothetical protein
MLGVPLPVLFGAWAGEGKRAAWLDQAGLAVRKATPDKSLRIALNDGSGLDVNLYAKGEGKSQVAIQHSKRPDAEAAALLKTFQGSALGCLEAFLEG